MLSRSAGKQILCEQIASVSSVGRLVMALGNVYVAKSNVREIKRNCFKLEEVAYYPAYTPHRLDNTHRPFPICKIQFPAYHTQEESGSGECRVKYFKLTPGPSDRQIYDIISFVWRLIDTDY